MTLAIGIGANTAIYSVLQAVWIDAVPFAGPSRLVVVSSAGEFSKTMAVSDADFAEWRAENHVFERLAAVDSGGELRSGDRRLSSTWTSDDFFATLDTRMHLGRALQASDARPDAPTVAVLDHRAWQRFFLSDPTVVGRRLDSAVGPVEIVGVAPPDFRISGFAPGAWVSKRVSPPNPERRGGRSLQVIGRLKPRVTLDEARADMNAIAARLAAARPESNARWPAVTITPIREKLAGEGVGESLWLLLGATTVVLLIACANLANLFLARGTRRRRELAIRATVGARRARIVRQILCESAVVALAGTLAGVLLTLWARDALLALIPFALHRGAHIAVDGRVLAFSACLGVATALGTGGLPAFRASSASPLDLLSGAAGQGATAARRTLASGLVALEVALSVVVLSAAGLLIGSFVKLRGVDPGFQPERILTFAIARVTPPAGAQEDTSRALYGQILETLGSIPQVERAAAAEMLPLSGNRSRYPHRVVDGAESGAGQTVDLDQRFVSAGYFEVLGVPVREGRTFDTSGRRGVVINERAARELWRGVSPIGRRIANGAAVDEVIGVVGDVHHVGLDADPVPEIYRRTDIADGMTFVVRTSVAPGRVAQAIQSAIESRVPVRLDDVRTFDDIVTTSVRVPLFRARLFGLMGILVAALAFVGVFSVTAYAVAERRREIGIRIALGAMPARTVGLILAQASLPAGVGLFAGLTAALNTNGLVSHFLFNTGSSDPGTLVTVAAAVFGTALLAAFLPARRALQIDPTVALRSE